MDIFLGVIILVALALCWFVSGIFGDRAGKAREELEEMNDD